MSDVQRQYFAASPTVNVGQADHAIDDPHISSTHGLRYSSPWPWISALTMSLVMWTLLGSLIWVLLR
jgi:hypothetical protein